MTTQPLEHWILAVDHRLGRLVRGQVTQGHAHLEEVARLVNDAPVPEHHPASALAGHGSHAYASLHHETEELRSRWATTVAAWLARSISASERVHVVAPGHLLGALRQAWPSHLQRRIDEHEGEFSALTASELVRHPTIARLLVAPPKK